MDEDLRSELEGMTPKSRDLLSRVITGDQVDRDTVVRSLMRYRAESGGEAPRAVVRDQDLVTGWLQEQLDDLGDHGFVFDDEHARHLPG